MSAEDIKQGSLDLMLEELRTHVELLAVAEQRVIEHQAHVRRLKAAIAFLRTDIHIDMEARK